MAAALRAALVETVGSDRFALWFGPRTRIDCDAQTVTIWTPNQFFLDWIRTNFRAAIEKTSASIIGQAVTVQFRVTETAETTH